jgi:Na+-transporting NADH:ubiquinone oxidoreductase subunit C
MNVQSNTYTIVYSSIIVLVVATLLTIAAVSLQPKQAKNIEIEKKQNILASARIESTVANAEELYAQYVKEVFVINQKGEKVEGVDAFSLNMREENKKPADMRNLAVYRLEKNDTSLMVVPLYGKGLWGPIWGYITFLQQDSVGVGISHFNTVYGAVYDHKGETPGLGAEINTDWFEHHFRGKSIFDNQGKFVSIEVVKGGGAGSDPHKVDAISGGTITSKGLQAMLDSCLVVYSNYFKQSK